MCVCVWGGGGGGGGGSGVAKVLCILNHWARLAILLQCSSNTSRTVISRNLVYHE